MDMSGVNCGWAQGGENRLRETVIWGGFRLLAMSEAYSVQRRGCELDF